MPPPIRWGAEKEVEPIKIFLATSGDTCFMNQEKPKLLIVTSEFPPGPGGIGNHAYCLARILVKNEWPVTVLSEERSAFLGESVELEGVRVEYLERKSTYLGRILTRYCTMKRMGREADIVITSGFWPSAYAGFLPKSSCTIELRRSFAS